MRFCVGHPQVNPLNGKAKQLPIFNPIDRHGRVFFFSWFSFMVSFAAWYAFPPLLTRSIRQDLQLTQSEVLNSNIVALIAGFVMRVCVGPFCDAFGPRRVMVGILVASSIPCGLAGTITTVNGLYAIRFFVGLAGASFVPAMAWCSSWYDREVVGTANGFAAGWGNAGAGVTYFLMPAVYDSFIRDHGHPSRVAWRLAFIVPTILLLGAATGALLLCEDIPTGAWKDRKVVAERKPEEVAAVSEGRDINNATAEGVLTTDSNSSSPPSTSEKENKGDDDTTEKHRRVNLPGQTTETHDYENGPTGAKFMEVVEKPSLKNAIPLIFTWQTLMCALPYTCSFGGELAVNSILSSWYLQRYGNIGWTQTKAGQVAAIFGLLNVVTRPAGGFLGDYFYTIVPKGKGVQSKKIWYMFLVFMQGVFLLWIGLVGNSLSPVGLVGGICAMAVFMDAANGAAYSLVPHVSPQINGIMSGLVGGSGNLGGVGWSIGYRFAGSYARGTWIIGVGSMVIALICVVIPPISKKQRLAGGYMSQ